MAKQAAKRQREPQPGWAIYLRTSSDENQKPEMSRERQRFAIEENVLKRSDLPVIGEYIDVLTGKNPNRKDYQRLLADARVGKFSHVIVERADRFGRSDTEALRAIDELHEFGVAVRFANSPDLDPQDPDDRILVALSFTLARRETALLGIRVKGGLRAKREIGGFNGRAPDGYRNVTERTEGDVKKLLGRTTTRIELDPDRAPIWRLAWDLLLEKELTLEQICEELHARGYRYRSGRSFIEIKPNGRRVANINTMATIFHNWTYAGWLTSESAKILPKTVRGNWQPLVTTEEFERGLGILEQRDKKRGRNRQHDYLLKGLVYWEDLHTRSLVRLTCSTSNAARSYGGTAYYCVARSNINFLCSTIDTQIPAALMGIQVDTALMPAIRAGYTQEVAAKLGHLRPNERQQLETALKTIDDEETRMLRLYVTGMITEAIWNAQWQEMQDRRSKVHLALESTDKNRSLYINSLDEALKILVKVGIMYNQLNRTDRKELLRLMVERVIISSTGKVRLELCAPFAYLHDLSSGVRGLSSEAVAEETKTAEDVSGLSSDPRSDKVLSC